MNKASNSQIYKSVCTFFGVGNIKFAPGTFGSLAGIFLWIFLDFSIDLLGLGNLFSYFFWPIFIVTLFFLGVYFSNIYARESGKKDASEIVIDEVVGQLIAIYLSYGFVSGLFSSKLAFICYFIVVFALFRLFDILKPSIIGYADKNIKGGLGVMLDDVLAGIFSAVIIDLIILIKLL